MRHDLWPAAIEAHIATMRAAPERIKTPAPSLFSRSDMGAPAAGPIPTALAHDRRCARYRGYH